MSLTKEFNAKAESKRSTAAETETWSETHHLSRYFCAVALRRKQEIEAIEVKVLVPVQPVVARRQLKV